MSGGTSREGMRFDYGTAWKGGPKFTASRGQTTLVFTPDASRLKTEAERAAWRKDVYARAEQMLGITRQRGFR